METAAQADEFGSTREELKKAKWLNKNLKSMLLEDGYRKPEINAIITTDNANYKALTEKMLCRLHCFGETKHRGSDLYLLPWCLDKWRRYLKERRLMKLYIDRLE